MNIFDSLFGFLRQRTVPLNVDIIGSIQKAQWVHSGKYWIALNSEHQEISLIILEMCSFRIYCQLQYRQNSLV